MSFNKEQATTSRAAERIERREFFRVQLKQSLLAQMNILSINGKEVNLDRKTEVLIRDISAGGIRLYSYLQLPIGHTIIYEFGFTLLDRRFDLSGIIVRMNQIRNDVYEYGVKFGMSEREREDLIGRLNKLSILLRNNATYADDGFIIESPITYLRKIK